MGYTRESLRRNGSSSIDDLIILPDFKLEELISGIKTAVQLGAIPKEYMGDYSSRTFLTLLEGEYDLYRLGYGEYPGWTEKVGDYLLNYLRKMESIKGAFGQIMPFVPHAGFGYILEDGGFITDAIDAAGVHRLRDIRQLAYLRDPVMNESDGAVISFRFSHNRYTHSLDVMAISTLILENNPELEEWEREARIAAIAHDTLTPAGGDTTKSVDPEAFDEDANFPEVYRRPMWKDFQKKYGVNEHLITRTILGKGILGKVLDCADKSAYVARDVQQYLDGGTNLALRFPGYAEGQRCISAIIEEDPYVCALWESTYVDGEHLVIGDDERLSRFLLLRALLFKYLYFNVHSRIVEYVAGLGVIQHLYEKGLVTREDLLTQGDQWLEQKINQLFGIDCHPLYPYDLSDVRIIENLSLQEAHDCADQHNKDPSIIALVDDFPYKASAGTDRFSVWCNDGVAVFEDAFPDVCAEIDEILTFPEGVNVYVIPKNTFKLERNATALLKEIFSYSAS